MLLWLSGPSGAGKSECIKRIRDSESLKDKIATFDLDFIGYRMVGEDWKKWHIPGEQFDVLKIAAERAKRSMLAVGCDSEPNRLREYALKAGFEIAFLIPSVSDIESFRNKRGDKQDKIATSAKDHSSWSARAAEWRVPVFNGVDDVISAFNKR